MSLNLILAPLVTLPQSVAYLVQVSVTYGTHNLGTYDCSYFNSFFFYRNVNVLRWFGGTFSVAHICKITSAPVLRRCICNYAVY